MKPQPLTMSSNYLAVVRGLRELHQLTEAGRLDSPEADAVRDATDAPWEALTEQERKRIGGLSEDLYSLTDPMRTSIKEVDPLVQARFVDIQQAQQRGEWDRVFELLRKWAAHIDPSLLSFLRGSTWLEADDPATATIFLKHARDLQRDNPTYFSMYLNSLYRDSPIEASRLSHEVLENPDSYSAVTIVNAANVGILLTKEYSEAEAARLFRRLVPILTKALSRIEGGDEGVVDGSTFSMVCVLLGISHEFLGENQAALNDYSKGLAVSPLDDALLVARGILLYGNSPRAVDDFQLAIRVQSPVVWPNFYLAHHYLVTKQFELCRVHCERALEMNGSDAIKSELAEWLAISQSELRFPADIVRASFERSLRFDPSNQRARRNLAIFEASTRPIPVSDYETRTTGAVRASGMSERRRSRAA